jgi:hypothetical protein
MQLPANYEADALTVVGRFSSVVCFIDFLAHERYCPLRNSLTAGATCR